VSTEASPRSEVDQRFSLANERTFLAYMRTALALLVGGVAGAKAVHFNHEVWRWLVTVPPIIGGGIAALEGARRYQEVERALQEGRALPLGPRLMVAGAVLAAYALLVLVAVVADG
jgi:putative membrane protein